MNNDSLKSISLAVIALCLFVQTIMQIINKPDSSYQATNTSAFPQSTDPALQPPAQTEPQNMNPPTTMEFDKLEHSFGEIPTGQKFTHKFKFKNTGSNPLIIQNAAGSCGCTVPQWPKEPIAPGASGEIVVEYDSTNKNGVQNTTVTLTANTTPPQTVLKVNANVLAAK